MLGGVPTTLSLKLRYVQGLICLQHVNILLAQKRNNKNHSQLPWKCFAPTKISNELLHICQIQQKSTNMTF